MITALGADTKTIELLLMALKDSQAGQIKLHDGASSEALVYLLKAHNEFSTIPAARNLLGITCADIAAAYANLEEFRRASTFARDAIAIVRGNQMFAVTEGNANMTLANALTSLGKTAEAESHYECALEIFQRMPSGAQFLKALEHNRARLCLLRSNRRSWWKFW